MSMISKTIAMALMAVTAVSAKDYKLYDDESGDFNDMSMWARTTDPEGKQYHELTEAEKGYLKAAVTTFSENLSKNPDLKNTDFWSFREAEKNMWQVFDDYNCNLVIKTDGEENVVSYEHNNRRIGETNVFYTWHNEYNQRKSRSDAYNGGMSTADEKTAVEAIEAYEKGMKEDKRELVLEGFQKLTDLNTRYSKQLEFRLLDKDIYNPFVFQKSFFAKELKNRYFNYTGLQLQYPFVAPEQYETEINVIRSYCNHKNGDHKQSTTHSSEQEAKDALERLNEMQVRDAIVVFSAGQQIAASDFKLNDACDAQEYTLPVKDHEHNTITVKSEYYRTNTDSCSCCADSKDSKDSSSSCCGSDSDSDKDSKKDDEISDYVPTCCNPDESCGCYSFLGCCSCCGCYQSYYRVNGKDADYYNGSDLLYTTQKTTTTESESSCCSSSTTTTEVVKTKTSDVKLDSDIYDYDYQNGKPIVDTYGEGVPQSQDWTYLVDDIKAARAGSLPQAPRDECYGRNGICSSCNCDYGANVNCCDAASTSPDSDSCAGNESCCGAGTGCWYFDPTRAWWAQKKLIQIVAIERVPVERRINFPEELKEPLTKDQLKDLMRYYVDQGARLRFTGSTWYTPADNSCYAPGYTCFGCNYCGDDERYELKMQTSQMYTYSLFNPFNVYAPNYIWYYFYNPGLSIIHFASGADMGPWFVPTQTGWEHEALEDNKQGGCGWGACSVNNWTGSYGCCGCYEPDHSDGSKDNGCCGSDEKTPKVGRNGETDSDVNRAKRNEARKVSLDYEEVEREQHHTTEKSSSCCGSSDDDKKKSSDDDSCCSSSSKKSDEDEELPCCCDPTNACGCYSYAGCCKGCGCWNSYYSSTEQKYIEREQKKNEDGELTEAQRNEVEEARIEWTRTHASQTQQHHKETTSSCTGCGGYSGDVKLIPEGSETLPYWNQLQNIVLSEQGPTVNVAFTYNTVPQFRAEPVEALLELDVDLLNWAEYWRNVYFPSPLEVAGLWKQPVIVDYLLEFATKYQNTYSCVTVGKDYVRNLWMLMDHGFTSPESTPCCTVCSGYDGACCHNGGCCDIVLWWITCGITGCTCMNCCCGTEYFSAHQFLNMQLDVNGVKKINEDTDMMLDWYSNSPVQKNIQNTNDARNLDNLKNLVVVTEKEFNELNGNGDFKNTMNIIRMMQPVAGSPSMVERLIKQADVFIGEVNKRELNLAAINSNDINDAIVYDFEGSNWVVLRQDPYQLARIRMINRISKKYYSNEYNNYSDSKEVDESVTCCENNCYPARIVAWSEGCVVFWVTVALFVPVWNTMFGCLCPGHKCQIACGDSYPNFCCFGQDAAAGSASSMRGGFSGETNFRGNMRIEMVKQGDLMIPQVVSGDAQECEATY